MSVVEGFFSGDSDAAGGGGGSFVPPDGVLYGVSGSASGLSYTAANNGQVLGVAAGALGWVVPAFGTPVSGVVTVDNTAKRVNSYRSSQSIESNVASAGTGVTVLEHVLNNTRSSKVLIQAWTARTTDNKIQTLDAARRVKYYSGAWTLATSGTDVPDDTDAIGTVWTIAIVAIGGGYGIRISAVLATGSYHGATITEVW